jgi:hypothetical protein
MEHQVQMVEQVVQVLMEHQAQMELLEHLEQMVYQYKNNIYKK